MNELPGTRLSIYDALGANIATVHFHLKPAGPSRRSKGPKGECIFELAPDWSSSGSSEARWIAKRRFEKVGEHRFRIDREGVITMHSGDFRLVLHPDPEDEDGGLRTAPPQPEIHAVWED